MNRLFHTSKRGRPTPTPAQSRAARPEIHRTPLPHNGRSRLLGGYQPDCEINNVAPPPRDRRTEVKARARHEFTFLPCDDMEQDTMRAVQHAERRKREKAMSIGDRVVMHCVYLAGAYMVIRGVAWCIVWWMTR